MPKRESKDILTTLKKVVNDWLLPQLRRQIHEEVRMVGQPTATLKDILDLWDENHRREKKESEDRLRGYFEAGYDHGLYAQEPQIPGIHFKHDKMAYCLGYAKGFAARAKEKL